LLNAKMDGTSTSAEPYFDMGPHTFRIPMTLFAENRYCVLTCCHHYGLPSSHNTLAFSQRLAAGMKEAGHSGVILIKGGKQVQT
jgi:hypothetical protein